MSISRTRNFFQRFCVDEYNIDTIKQSSFLSADLLPSLGARINQSTKLRKHIISPFNPRYRYFSHLLNSVFNYSRYKNFELLCFKYSVFNYSRYKYF